jgi:hypothetical protein
MHIFLASRAKMNPFVVAVVVVAAAAAVDAVAVSFYPILPFFYSLYILGWPDL